MNREDITRMAREAGGIDMTNHIAGGITAWLGTGTQEFLERFAQLVAADAIAKEREACAKVCEELAKLSRISDTDSMWEWGECAAAIRARGNV